MMRTALLCLGAAVLMTCAASADAAPAPSARTFAGSWRITTPDGRTSCALSLKAAKAPHGYALTIGRDCGDAFPLQSVVAWKPYADGMVLMSETGFPVQTFEQAEQGLYVSDGGEPFTLRVDAGPRLSQSAVKVPGRWTLGPVTGAAFCVLDLEASGGAHVAGACRPEWRAKAIASWRLQDHRLTLADAAGRPVTTYVQRDPNTFEDERTLETPIQLWRPVR